MPNIKERLLGYHRKRRESGKQITSSSKLNRKEANLVQQLLVMDLQQQTANRGGENDEVIEMKTRAP
jgi:hypothetical protein